MVCIDDRTGSGDSTTVATLESLTDRVMRDMEHAAALHANLDRMGRDDSLAKAFNDTPHVRALNTVYQALLEQLVLVLTRMYDRADKPSQKDRASLQMVQRLLQDDTVQVYLIGEAVRRWPHPLGVDKVKETARKHLFDIIENIDKVIQAAPFDEWMRSLRNYRNIFVGHSLIKKIERPPVYASMEEVLRETLRIGSSLRLVLRHQHQDWEQSLRARAKEATCFWDAVLRGMNMPRRDPWI
jgi:hypothetical protein